METATQIEELGEAGGLALESAPTSGDAVPSRWVDFYELTKPRMNFLVVVTTMVGYYMAAHGPADWLRVVYTLIGTALTAAGSSVFNQYIERSLDLRMTRTANRPLPGGRDELHGALKFGLGYRRILRGHLLIGAVRHTLAGQLLPVARPVAAERTIAVVDEHWPVGVARRLAGAGPRIFGRQWHRCPLTEKRDDSRGSRR